MTTDLEPIEYMAMSQFLASPGALFSAIKKFCRKREVRALAVTAEAVRAGENTKAIGAAHEAEFFARFFQGLQAECNAYERQAIQTSSAEPTREEENVSE